MPTWHNPEPAVLPSPKPFWVDQAPDLAERRDFRGEAHAVLVVRVGVPVGAGVAGLAVQQRVVVCRATAHSNEAASRRMALPARMGCWSGASSPVAGWGTPPIGIGAPINKNLRQRRKEERRVNG